MPVGFVRVNAELTDEANRHWSNSDVQQLYPCQVKLIKTTLNRVVGTVLMMQLSVY